MSGWLGLSVVLAMAAATPKQASDNHRPVATGTLIPGRNSAVMGSVPNVGPMEERPSDAAVAAARKMVSCAIQKRPQIVKAWMDAYAADLTKPNPPAFDSVMHSCFGRGLYVSSALTVKHGTLYGLIAEQYFRQTGVPSLENRSGVDYKNEPEFAGLNPLWRIGTCLTFEQPRLAAALVVSQPETSAEKSAIAAIAPYIAACVDRGVTARLTATSLRIGIASAIYRNVPRPPVVAATETSSK